MNCFKFVSMVALAGLTLLAGCNDGGGVMDSDNGRVAGSSGESRPPDSIPVAPPTTEIKDDSLAAVTRTIVGVWRGSGVIYVFYSDNTYVDSPDINSPDIDVVKMAKAGQFGKRCRHYVVEDESNVWLDTCPCDAKCAIGGQYFVYNLSADGKTLTIYYPGFDRLNPDNEKTTFSQEMTLRKISD